MCIYSNEVNDVCAGAFLLFYFYFFDNLLQFRSFVTVHPRSERISWDIFACDTLFWGHLIHPNDG